MKLETVVLTCLIVFFLSFMVGAKVGLLISKTQTDSLITHCGKWTVDLPYRLDSSTEGNLLARTIGDTLYIYHRPYINPDSTAIHNLIANYYKHYNDSLYNIWDSEGNGGTGAGLDKLPYSEWLKFHHLKLKS